MLEVLLGRAHASRPPSHLRTGEPDISPLFSNGACLAVTQQPNAVIGNASFVQRNR